MGYKSNLTVLLALVLALVCGSGCQGKRDAESSAKLSLKRVHFDFDQATLRPDMVEILDNNTMYLKDHPSVNVVIEGHCDERGTNEYNLALGDSRSATGKKYLTSKGISPARIRIISYGEEKPLDNEHNEAAWYNNRRAEFVRQ